jgi:tRNA-dihydrouridine synthase 1
VPASLLLTQYRFAVSLSKKTKKSNTEIEQITMGAEEIESCHKDEEKIRRKAAKREKKEKKKLHKESKEKKKEKKSKKHEIENKEERPKKRKKRSFSSEETSSNSAPQNDGKVWKQHVDCILAPMVGASELAFRLLCRKYGAQLAYTPMMSSAQICNEPGYLESEFQTVPEDRPLVCHMSANVPEEFAKAARLLEPHCDAIDLNLGCPQRTA